MKSLLKDISFALLSLGFAVGAQAQPDVINRFVLEDQNAVTVVPAELIAAPQIKKVYYAPDGLSLVVLRERMKITPDLLPDGTGKPQKLPEGEQELIYWSSRTRTARSFWKGNLFGMKVWDVTWMPQTENAFVLMQTEPLPLAPNPPQFKAQWTLLKMAEGQARPTEIPLPDVGSNGHVSVSASNVLSLVWLQINQQEEEQTRPDGSVINHQLFYLLRREGRLEKPVAFPDPADVMVAMAEWAKDGTPALMIRGLKDKKRLNYAVNPQTLALTLLEGKFEHQDWEEPNRTKAGMLTLKSQSVTANAGETQKKLSVLWLESSVKSEFPRMVLAGDATEGVLRPKADGAFYQSQGALWFAPFLRMNQAQFLTARKAALKAVAISNAKQAGTGLMMYAQDYDEVLPTPDGIKDKVMPYVKNEAILDGLVYTYPGGKLADIDKPAETLMGYVLGPGGRANIYVDGHVKWKDDEKGSK